jgi:hypothetical protein
VEAAVALVLELLAPLLPGGRWAFWGGVAFGLLLALVANGVLGWLRDPRRPWMKILSFFRAQGARTKATPEDVLRGCVNGVVTLVLLAILVFVAVQMSSRGCWWRQ